jgi:transcription-repair coupling factor (superfamily II helicase)
VAAEWVDRYGPIPDEAEGLLAVAHLRVEALRIGIEEISVQSRRTARGVEHTARIQPVDLRASSQVKLRRLAPGSTFRETQRQLLLVVPERTEVAPFLSATLAELVPEG